MARRVPLMKVVALLCTGSIAAGAQVQRIAIENHIATPGTALVKFVNCAEQRIALPASTRPLAWLNGGLTDKPGVAHFVTRSCPVTSIAVTWNSSPTICVVAPFTSAGDRSGKYLVVGDRIRDCIERKVYSEAEYAKR